MRFSSILLLAFILTIACAQVNDIYWNATHGYYGSIENLLDEGVDVNARDARGRTPLILASCRHRQTRAVQVLLDRGANVNAQDNEGMSPLMRAATCSNAKITNNLLNHGADVHARTSEGLTALIYASLNGSTEVV